MIITLVTDQFFQNNHGTSVSAQRIYDGLVKRGHTVRVLAIAESGETAYALKEKYYGKFINKVINSQGFQLAKTDKETIAKAVEGADIVHIYLPFKLGYKTIQVCREMNVPCTAAFHILPENITATLYMKKVKPVNFSIWVKFYLQTYRYVKHIHCPSLMVAKQLEARKFNANLHVISNGFSEEFRPLENPEKPEEFKDKFVISFVGRFSREKRYDLIIKAVKKSKYKDKIQLVFGGQGPIKNQIMRSARALPNYPIFSFFTREQLCEIFNYSDLYIHPADIEVEGMTCLEAIACGCPALVSDSDKSATPQFVVDKENSIFKHGDANDLARKIDFWIEHQDLLKEQREKTLLHASKFDLDKSMDYYIEMFEEAIADFDPNYDGLSKAAIKPKIINYYE